MAKSPFFVKLANGAVVFGERSKYASMKVEDVARRDPDYLRWARRSGTIGLSTSLFDLVTDIMKLNGVSFEKQRKKPTRTGGRKKS